MDVTSRPLRRPRRAFALMPSLRRTLPPLLLALALVLLGAAPALAGAFVDVESGVLSYHGELDQSEPDNVTIARSGGMLRLDEDASRMTVGSGCVVSPNGYHVTCDATGVTSITVQTSDLGSDVRIRADLPATIHGGAGDDALIGGPADDVIDGGGGQDVLGGGGGADELHGGSGVDLVTYEDRIGSDGTLLPRHQGVRVKVGADGASGARGEGDTIATDVEQVEGTAANDVFDLRDGRGQAIACDGGRDLVIADPRDDPGIDCETTRVAPAPHTGRMTIPTLVFPFTGHADRGRGSIDVGPLLPLQHGAIIVRVHCPIGVGLLDIDGPGCRGRVRFTRPGGLLGIMRIGNIARGRTVTLRLPLHDSRALARRARGLAVTATALPVYGAVARALRFTVRG
jgi:hemolysin type calcium-binding protein